MARRRLFLGVRVGPFIVGGSTSGRRRQRYQPGRHPMMQPTIGGSIREMIRRRTQGR